MPRIAISVTLVDDVNRPLTSENWSPLGYEDLGNPNLFVEHPQGLLNSDAERNLMDRLRTSIDRALMIFARRERRRFRSSVVQPNPDTPVILDDNALYQTEYMGEFLPDPDPVIPTQQLIEAQRMALIAEQPMIEDQRVMGTMEPKKKRVRSVKRVSRYKRDPVI